MRGVDPSGFTWFTYHDNEKIGDPHLTPGFRPRPNWSEDPLEALNWQELHQLAINAARALPENHRNALRLRYANGLSYSEIAEEFQVPLGTVKTWLFRGVERLGM